MENVVRDAAVFSSILFYTSDDNSEGLLSGTATGGDVAEGTRQLQIEVRNKLVTAGAATRKSGSIALNTENEITAMDFYVFASDDEFGTYTFQEKLSYRAGHEGDKIEGATPFILVTNSNNNAFSSAQLTIKKGLYVRLYCVANATQLYVLNEKKILKFMSRLLWSRFKWSLMETR